GPVQQERSVAVGESDVEVDDRSGRGTLLDRQEIRARTIGDLGGDEAAGRPRTRGELFVPSPAGAGRRDGHHDQRSEPGRPHPAVPPAHQNGPTSPKYVRKIARSAPSTLPSTSRSRLVL